MGFFDSIVDIGKSALGAVTGGLTSSLFNLPGQLIQGGLNMFSAKQAQDNAEANARDAYRRSVEQYRTRYQNTVEDMRKAGLNPIMAASGGFNVGGQAQAPMAQTFMAAPIAQETGSTTARNVAETEKTQMERHKVLAEISYLGDQSAKAIQETYESNARERVATAQEENLKNELIRIKAETMKLAYEISKVDEETKNILHGRELIKQNVRQMKAIADKLEMTNKNYTGPMGDLLGFINALTDALNLGFRR